MTSAEWEEITALFEAALEHNADQRAAWLHRVCEDARVRREVETLLTAHEHAAGFLEQPAASLVPELWRSAADTAANGRQIGRYRILGKIAQGGMGTVYLAEGVIGPIKRRVALKLMRTSFRRDDLAWQFLQEQRALAALEHPGIARLYDAGTEPDGTAWFAMEYIDGLPIHKYCNRRGLSIDARLRLFIQVGKAVQYAHRHLVVHRDLKPSNVLVNGEGQIKLLDFGVAKLLSAKPIATNPAHRRPHWVTPEYAAPEQISTGNISTATDVYALGGLLYELLSGRPPFDLEGCAGGEIKHVICEQAPSPPSTIAPAWSEQAHPAFESATPRLLRRRLQGDLDTIVLKALSKDAESRYASAEALSDDIRRHLKGLPVNARSETLRYRTRKFVLRHRFSVSASAAIVALTICFTGFHMHQISQARQQAETARYQAEAVSGFLTQLFEKADPLKTARSGSMTVRDLLDRGAQQLRTHWQAQPAIQAELMTVIGKVYTDLGLYEQGEPLLRNALAQRMKSPGAEHIETANTAHDLGYLLFRQGRYHESDALYRQALAVFQASGDRAAQAGVLHDRGVLLDETGQLDEAESALRKSLQRRKSSKVLIDLALVLQDQGKLDEAIALNREALRQLKHAGAEAPQIANAMTYLAFAMQRKNKFSDAEALYRQSLATRREALPAGHPHIASSLVRLAWVLAQEGKGREAEALAREGYGILHKRLPENHWQVVAASGVLALSWVVQGRFAQGEQPLIKSYRTFRRRFGDDDWRTRSTLKALIGLYRAWHKPKKAAHYANVLAKH